ncbi:MAG: TadE/TadG family type IV pilus assembly protein, partial [Pseudomonadota bacterium]
RRLVNAPGRMRTLGRDKKGAALLEFALTLPLLLTMGLTGAEITNYIITKMRISQIALHLADNAARIGTGSQLQAKSITETDINDLLTGAQLQSGELDLVANGRIIISSLEPVANPNTTNKYKIGWQRCKGAKTTKTSGYGVAGQSSGLNMNGMGPSGRQAVAPDGGSTMFVEVYYEYKPLIRTSLSPDSSMTEIASMMVRDRRDLSTIYNVENATRSTC